MSRESATRLVLRAVAITIAVLALIDPAIRSDRRRDATIVVSAPDSARDSELADRVTSTLAKRFDVSRVAVAGADAAVIVGTRIPLVDNGEPTFIVTPDSRRPGVTIASLTAPHTGAVQSRVPVSVQAYVVGSRGRSVEAALSADGVIIDRVTRKVDRDDDTLALTLNYVPTSAGEVLLGVTTSVGADGRSDTESALVDIRDVRHAVLFHDPRPSWPSTFVRRLVEDDPRFAVTSRTITSRNISTDAGAPPSSLQDATALNAFDAIVIGAPEALSVAEVAALDGYLRKRGGAVILLLDQRTAGAYDGLTGTANWSMASSNQPVGVRAATGDTATLKAMSLAWPVSLPAGSAILAGDVKRPVVWEAHVGAGRLFVSGALDSWRFRDSLESSFDRFWRTVIAEAAASSPAATELNVPNPVVRPGADVEIDATLRDVTLRGAEGSPLKATVTARADSVASLRLWPSGLGKLRGVVRAPIRPGIYRVGVSDGRATASAAFVVDSATPRGIRMPDPALAAWTAIHRGSVVSESALGTLADRIQAGISAQPRVETSHPMRSAWWIVPFTLALAAEWWLRRRRGFR